MFRPTALRSLQRAVPGCNVALARISLRNATFKVQLSSRATAVQTPQRLALTIRKPLTTSLVRYQSTINKAAEEEYRKHTLQPHPETVSTDSSVRPVTSEFGVDDPEPDVDMMAGAKSDFVGTHGFSAIFSKVMPKVLIFLRKPS